MSFISARKPLNEWKWYIRARDKSIHQSPDVVADAIEVSAPPNPETYTWDWVNNVWKYDLSHMKRCAQNDVLVELTRLSKFNMLTDPTILASLHTYVEALQQYIKNFTEQSSFPLCPAELEEEAFFA